MDRGFIVLKGGMLYALQQINHDYVCIIPRQVLQLKATHEGMYVLQGRHVYKSVVNESQSCFDIPFIGRMPVVCA